MSISKRNQEKLQLQQLEQANGGVLLKNIFGIYASHPWLSILFVIVFGLFTSSLYEIITSYFAESSYDRATICIIALVLAAILIVIFILVWVLHSGSVKQKDIVQKKVLITLASAYKKDIKETPSFGVLNALLYNSGGHSKQNQLQEVIIVCTEEKSTQEVAEKLADYVETLERKAKVMTVSVDDRYPKDIENQLSLILAEVMKDYSANDIVCDYTGGTKNMSVALYTLSRSKYISAVYLYDAMTDRSKQNKL
jgi:hypothetical protein